MLKSEGIDEKEEICDLSAESQGFHSLVMIQRRGTHSDGSDLSGKDHKIIFTHWKNINNVGIFEFSDIRTEILTE